MKRRIVMSMLAAMMTVSLAAAPVYAKGEKKPRAGVEENAAGSWMAEAYREDPLEFILRQFDGQEYYGAVEEADVEVCLALMENKDFAVVTVNRGDDEIITYGGDYVSDEDGSITITDAITGENISIGLAQDEDGNICVSLPDETEVPMALHDGALAVSVLVNDNYPEEIKDTDAHLDELIGRLQAWEDDGEILEDDATEYYAGEDENQDDYDQDDYDYDYDDYNDDDYGYGGHGHDDYGYDDYDYDDYGYGDYDYDDYYGYDEDYPGAENAYGNPAGQLPEGEGRGAENDPGSQYGEPGMTAEEGPYEAPGGQKAPDSQREDSTEDQAEYNWTDVLKSLVNEIVDEHLNDEDSKELADKIRNIAEDAIDEASRYYDESGADEKVDEYVSAASDVFRAGEAALESFINSLMEESPEEPSEYEDEYYGEYPEDSSEYEDEYTGEYPEEPSEYEEAYTGEYPEESSDMADELYGEEDAAAPEAADTAEEEKQAPSLDKMLEDYRNYPAIAVSSYCDRSYAGEAEDGTLLLFGYNSNENFGAVILYDEDENYNLWGGIVTGDEEAEDGSIVATVTDALTGEYITFRLESTEEGLHVVLYDTETGEAFNSYDMTETTSDILGASAMFALGDIE